jgi:hypothetical protein
MLAMSQFAFMSSPSPPRRFILLPEETADGRAKPRIRRYRLTSVGQGTDRSRGGPSGSDAATARIACEFGRLGRM